MKITLIVEGKTETASLPHLRGFLESHLQGNMPRIDVTPYDGRIPTHEKLQRIVHYLLSGKKPSDHVIALTDVYTGCQPPDFSDASDAKNKMREWVGKEQRFHPHAAQYDFEAWLLPYWGDIQRLAGHNRVAPRGNPEQVNHDNPPSYRIKEIFRIGSKGRAYMKPRDAGRILRDNDLSFSVSHCAELKSFVNTILKVCNGVVIP